MTDAHDPYLWLEEVEGARALAWVRERDEGTTAVLCDDAFAADKEAIYEISTRPTNIPFITRRGRFVYNFWQDQTHVRGLWRRTTLDDYRNPEPAWDVLLDLDALARREAEDWVWRGCSTLEPDHRIGLVSLSRGGADATVMREFDLEAKRFVEEGFALPEAKGGAAWIDRDTLMVSVTLGEDAATASGYPRQVRRWRRGGPFGESPMLFEGERSDVWISGYVDREPGFERTFYRRQITFEEGESFLAGEGGALTRIDVPLDARFSVDRDWMFVRLKSDWSVGGRTYPADALLAIPFSGFLSGRRDFSILFEPGPRRVLESFFWASTRLFITVLDNLESEILTARPDAEGWRIAPLDGLPSAANVDVWPLDAGSLERTDEALVSVTSFLAPSSLGMIDADGRFEILKEAPAAFDATGLAATRHEAIAADGERIPYFEIGRADRTGPAPTVLYGYGGFSVSMTPSYLGSIGRVWLERGGVWVVAVIRGGGEFGSAWHKAGMREGKRTSHDDFATIAADLVRRGVTTPPQLAAYGGSNGGLLVGNMLTRYPDRFGAIWCTVPLLDMRRYTGLLAGASWIAEYGDPDKPEDWAYMQGFSAYHNLEPERAYPPVLLVTSRRDDRVHPGHARKMAARLAEIGADVLFYEPDEGGHGAANKEQAAFLSALGFAFLRRTIGQGGSD
ncbi:MAG TPA: prolyl oligopeptidase family serine peptidase [Salinarimonas sp.]|nr:prolyl oligopeptidase family serine peptidase [Salinarimonas sp.]